VSATATAGPVAVRHRSDRSAAATAALRPVGQRPGAFGRVQLVGVEVGVAGSAVAALTGSVAVVPAAVAGSIGLVALLVTLSRAGGRWAYQAVGLRMALRRRRRTWAAGELAPGLLVHDHDDRGRPVGIGQDDQGWFAAVRIGVPGEMLADAGQRVGLDRLLRMLDEGGTRPSALQLVNLRMSAPSSLLVAGSPAARSHLELMGQAQVPAVDLSWIAIRLDPADAIQAASDRGGGTDGVHRTLAALVARLAKQLTSAGVPHEVLDAAALSDAVRTSCGTAGTAAVAQAESPRAWDVDGRRHVAFEVERWPAPLHPALLQELGNAPVDRVIVSVVVRNRSGAVGLRGTVGVLAAPDRVDGAVQVVKDKAATVGVRLRPLHHQHRPAVYASAPTGGGAW